MQFTCEQCGIGIEAAAELRGRTARCPHCGERTRLFEDVPIDVEAPPVQPQPAATNRNPPQGITNDELLMRQLLGMVSEIQRDLQVTRRSVHHIGLMIAIAFALFFVGGGILGIYLVMLLTGNA